MSSFNGWGRAAIALGAVALLTAPALTQSGGKLAALARLEPGLWQLRDLDSDERYPPICVADPAILLPLQQHTSPCHRLVIFGDVSRAHGHSPCPANAFVRNDPRGETPA